MPGDSEWLPAIDNPQQTERLLARLSDHVPFTVFVRPLLADVIRQTLPTFDASRPYQVAKVHYLGDPGGIMCHLEIPEMNGKVFVVSLTHLLVDARMPLAREIAIYQKHRAKRIRRTARLAAHEALDRMS